MLEDKSNETCRAAGRIQQPTNGAQLLRFFPLAAREHPKYLHTLHFFGFERLPAICTTRFIVLKGIR